MRGEREGKAKAGCSLLITPQHSFLVTKLVFVHFCLVKISLHICGTVWDKQETGIQVDR